MKKLVFALVFGTVLMSACSLLPDTDSTADFLAADLNNTIKSHSGLTYAVAAFMEVTPKVIGGGAMKVPELEDTTPEKFSDSLSHSLVEAFSRTLKRHKVVDRALVRAKAEEMASELKDMRYDKAQAKIAEALGVDYIVIGTIRWHSGKEWIVNSQIINKKAIIENNQEAEGTFFEGGFL